MKIVVIPVILIINFFCLWYFFAFLGVNNVHPIGFTDAYGYVYPPAWLFFITLFLSIIEYAALNTVFTIKKMENQDLD
jgi:hypothetical protein